MLHIMIRNVLISKSSNSINFKPNSTNANSKMYLVSHHIIATNILAYKNKEDLIVWKTSFIF